MVRVRDRHGIAVVEVFGDIDVFNAEATAGAIAAAVSGRARFVISLEHCRYCDSSGAGIIVKLIRQRRQFAIVARARVRKVLELMQLHKLVPFACDVTDAVDRLQASGLRAM